MVLAQRHLLAVRRVRADRRDDAIGVAIGAAGDDRQVLLRHLAIVKLRGERLVGRVGLGDDDHAARVAIEPMDDSRPRRAADAAELVEPMHQRPGQRARPVPLGRMHDHARRLVDDHDRVVLEQHVERDGLGLRPLGRGRHVDLDSLARRHAVRRLLRNAIDRDGVLVDAALDSRPTGCANHRGQERVEPPARRGVIDDQREMFAAAFARNGRHKLGGVVVVVEVRRRLAHG